MNLGVTMAGRALAAAAITYRGNASLTFYSGTMPSTPETPLSGNTALVSWLIQGPAYASLSGGDVVSQFVFVNNTSTIINSGTVTFARLAPASWAQNTSYIQGQAVVTVDGYIAFGTANGTSSNTGLGPIGATLAVNSEVQDGTMTWAGYAVAGTALADFTVGTSGSGADIIVSSTTLTAGNLESITHTLKMPYS